MHSAWRINSWHNWAGLGVAKTIFARLGLRQREAQEGELFLPDFCAIHWLLPIVLIAQLLAFIIILSRPVNEFWLDLGLVSLFIQWIALSSAGLLCVFRPWLKQWPDGLAGLVSYLLLVAVVCFWSEIATQLVIHFQVIGLITEHRSFMVRNGGVSAIVYGLFLHYLYILQQWKRQVNAEADARFQALQARIRPHFLFNSMNTIANLVHQNPTLAEEIIEDLADLFRMNMRDAQQFITLDEELALVEKYLHIEQSRLGERLQVNWQLQAELPLQTRLPALILQPLVENAVYHGIEPLVLGGTITLSGTVQGPQVCITITNPVPSEDETPSNREPNREGHHLAIDNIRQRLALIYPNQGVLTQTRTPQQYQVVLTFPLNQKDYGYENHGC